MLFSWFKKFFPTSFPNLNEKPLNKMFKLTVFLYKNTLDPRKMVLKDYEHSPPPVSIHLLPFL